MKIEIFKISYLSEIDKTKEYFMTNSKGILLYGPNASKLQPILQEKYSDVNIILRENKQLVSGYYLIGTSLEELNDITGYKKRI